MNIGKYSTPSSSTEGLREVTAGDVICPCCGQRSSEFLPFGQPPRPGARCPHCLCLERHRLMWLYLQNCTGFFHDQLRVFHFAPEPFFLNAFQALATLDYISAGLKLPYAAL